jgi:hypothetical protein
MTGTLARLDAFIARWSERLCADSAVVRIITRPAVDTAALHTDRKSTRLNSSHEGSLA